MNMSMDEALALTESAGFADTAKAILAAEVRRLRDEVNGLTGSLDRAEKALKEAREQEPVAYRIDWPDGLVELAWQADGYDEDYVEIRGLPTAVPLGEMPCAATKPAAELDELEMFERGWVRLSEAVKHPVEPAAPAAILVESHQIKAVPAEDPTEMRRVIAGVADRLGLPTENGNRLHDLSFWLDSPPAVAVPAVPTDEQIHAAYRKALDQSIRERDMPEIRKFARALLQSAAVKDSLTTQADCRTCANRGQVNGLSQESYCDSCIYQGRDWRKNHFVDASKTADAVKRRCDACAVLPCSCE